MNINSIEKILALLTAIIWGIFTLIPNSHSLMATWSWVFVWQIGLLFPVLWAILLSWQEKISFPKNQLKSIVFLVLLGTIISSSFSLYPQLASWHSWTFFSLLSCLLAIFSSLKTYQQKYRLISIYGYVSFAFIAISLYIWLTNTLFPEISRLNALNQRYNLSLKFDFSVLELRNWAPIGHQNYVAGYLLLCLPVFVALILINKGKQRYFWLTGLVLGSIDLYSTSSRGGWLGLAVTCLVSLVILLFKSKLPRSWLLSIGLAIFSLLGTSLLANNRLSSIFSGGEFAYRWINANIGWNMGISNLFTGVGLGGVPLLYQKYRPAWAGRESELAYQLHSTPVQLFAEMGIWGLLAWLGSIVFCLQLFYKMLRFNKLVITVREYNLSCHDRTIDYAIFAGLLGYAVISITDYQLDNLSISGTLVLFIACLLFSDDRNTSEVRSTNKLFNKLLHQRFGSIVLTICVILYYTIGLYPIHRAWQISSQGFSALSDNKIDVFIEKLESAHKLVPWESYYPYQLGWNLGNLALTNPTFQQQQQILQASIKWLETANKISPSQEFGRTNLGWLLLRNNPSEATKSFAKAAELVPAKQGNFSNIAISLLLQRKIDLAIEAFTIEILRDPLFITNPIWGIDFLKPLYPKVINNLEKKYAELNQQYPDNNYWRICQTSLYWWQGKVDRIKQKSSTSLNPILDLIIDLDEQKNITEKLAKLPDSSAKSIVRAWLEPQQRAELIQKAWVLAKQSEIEPKILQKHLDSMAKSQTLSQWLRQNAPSWTFRKEREGFGIVSRHLDGTTPIDFNQITENIPMEIWFADLFPAPVYAPEIDLSLQQWRTNLLQQL
jgi:uncharacterized protein involved in response to NO